MTDQERERLVRRVFAAVGDAAKAGLLKGLDLESQSTIDGVRAVAEALARKMTQDKRCAGCTFWVPSLADEGEASGSCRRYAPQPAMLPKGQLGIVLTWPVMDQNDWCGEFKPRGA